MSFIKVNMNIQTECSSHFIPHADVYLSICWSLYGWLVFPRTPCCRWMHCGWKFCALMALRRLKCWTVESSTADLFSFVHLFSRSLKSLGLKVPQHNKGLPTLKDTRETLEIMGRKVHPGTELLEAGQHEAVFRWNHHILGMLQPNLHKPHKKGERAFKVTQESAVEEWFFLCRTAYTNTQHDIHLYLTYNDNI